MSSKASNMNSKEFLQTLSNYATDDDFASNTNIDLILKENEQVLIREVSHSKSCFNWKFSDKTFDFDREIF